MEQDVEISVLGASNETSYLIGCVLAANWRPG
jgi:hypothetical protein